MSEKIARSFVSAGFS